MKETKFNNLDEESLKRVWKIREYIQELEDFKDYMVKRFKSEGVNGNFSDNF